MKKAHIYTMIIGSLMVASCSNGDVDFPDFDYQTVYFANQYADRIIELGEDENVDLSSDNKHIVSIKAAWGGGYKNGKDVLINYVVDESLVDNLYFKNTDKALEVMPAEYYALSDKSTIRIPAGQMMGGVTVQLTDAFFNDPKSVDHCYVIPLRMTNVQGADSILSGKPLEDNPVLTNDSHWAVQPKNFVLYAVSFVNPWHGQYLRRGVDNATIDGQSKTIVRHQEHVEKDEVVDVTTTGMKSDVLPISVKDAEGNNITFNVTLNFSDDNNCTLGSGSENVTVTGTGRFVQKGEKNSLGGKDRNALYLEYNADLTDHNMKFASKDTLVLRTRNVYGGATLGVDRK